MKKCPKILSAKLKAYSLLAASASGLNLLDAQIYYHDFDPDIELTTANDDTYLFNLDLYTIYDWDLKFSLNKTIYDFTDSWGGAHYHVTQNRIYLSLFHGNEAMGLHDPLALDEGDLISSGQSWNYYSDPIVLGSLVKVVAGTSPDYLTTYTGNGFWVGKFSKYLGFKILLLDGDAVYGWLRLSVSENCDTLTIYDYAYNSVAGDSIIAGQKTTGISNSLLNCFQNQLTTHLTEDMIIHAPDLKIVNLSGQVIFQEKLRANKTFDLNFLRNGVYLVEINTPDKVLASQKILITHG